MAGGMEGAFLALLLTVSAAGLDRIEVVREFRSAPACLAFAVRARRRADKIGCVPRARYLDVRNEVFR